MIFGGIPYRFGKLLAAVGRFTRLDASAMSVLDDGVFPLTDRTQLIGVDAASDDRMLIRDTSAGTHKFITPYDAGGRIKIASGTHSGTSLPIDVRAAGRTHLQVKIWNVIPVADVQDLWMRVAHDTVPTFITGAGAYLWRNQSQSAGGVVSVGSDADSNIQITGSDGLGNAANERGCYVIDFFDPYNATIRPAGVYQGGARTANTARGEIVEGFFERNATDDITFIQFLLSGGGSFSCNYSAHAEA